MAICVVLENPYVILKVKTWAWHFNAGIFSRKFHFSSVSQLSPLSSYPCVYQARIFCKGTVASSIHPSPFSSFSAGSRTSWAKELFFLAFLRISDDEGALCEGVQSARSEKRSWNIARQVSPHALTRLGKHLGRIFFSKQEWGILLLKNYMANTNFARVLSGYPKRWPGNHIGSCKILRKEMSGGKKLIKRKNKWTICKLGIKAWLLEFTRDKESPWALWESVKLRLQATVWDNSQEWWVMIFFVNITQKRYKCLTNINKVEKNKRRFCKE